MLLIYSITLLAAVLLSDRFNRTVLSSAVLVLRSGWQSPIVSASSYVRLQTGHIVGHRLRLSQSHDTVRLLASSSGWPATAGAVTDQVRRALLRPDHDTGERLRPEMRDRVAAEGQFDVRR